MGRQWRKNGWKLALTLLFALLVPFLLNWWLLDQYPDDAVTWPRLPLFLAMALGLGALSMSLEGMLQSWNETAERRREAVERAAYEKRERELQQIRDAEASLQDEKAHDVHEGTGKSRGFDLAYPKESIEQLEDELLSVASHDDGAVEKWIIRERLDSAAAEAARLPEPVPGWGGPPSLDGVGTEPEMSAADRAALPAPSLPAMPLPPFSAFPRLDLLRPDLAPLAAIAPGDRLAVVTGFRPDPDLSLPDSAAITVDNPQPGQTCELRLIGKGLDLDVASASLPLRDDVKLTFGATVQPDAREIELQVQFYIGGVLLGAASRSLPVGAIAPDETNPCRMGTDRLAPVDMTATVSYAADGKLQWILSAPRVAPLPSAPLPSTFPDARGFAANVLRQLEPLKYGGQEARNALESFGQEIADRMPAEFFRVLGMAAAVARGEGRLPSLLLLTDEVYIPWELALLETPLSAAAPPFLGAQVEMGRWVVRDRVQLPPYADCEVRRFPVFASQYGLASATKQRELTEALGERQTLVERYADWHAAPLQACRQDFQPLLAEPPTAGQAVHFAVHGLSDPEADRQQLVLEDQRIPPAALSGAYRCGQTPRFSFVFMNACQVGTPGHELGELAGFPGALVRAGCRGVVAPLWDVHDGAARQCAEAFYHDVFEQQLSVGAALRARRAAYGNESATPLAYVYYGHPGLKFTRGDADGK